MPQLGSFLESGAVRCSLLGWARRGVELTPLPVHRMAVALLVCLAVAGANKVPDPYKEGDPIHDDAFRKAYLHNDGTINEKVLVKLHEYHPAAPLAPPRERSCVVGTCCTKEARPSPPLEHSTNTPHPGALQLSSAINLRVPRISACCGWATAYEGAWLCGGSLARRSWAALVQVVSRAGGGGGSHRRSELTAHPHGCRFSPLASGAIPGFAGVLVFLMIFGMGIYWAMTSMKCFEPRVSPPPSGFGCRVQGTSSPHDWTNSSVFLLSISPKGNFWQREWGV